MKKQEIYVNLQGKTKEELTDLWEFLKENKGHTYSDFRLNKYNEVLDFSEDEWIGNKLKEVSMVKTEVTIDQLKQIIKPMETKFTPIAMRCTQEQFEAIKPKLEGFTFECVGSFNIHNYLVNNGFDKLKNITNVNYPLYDENRTVHETFNEELFLKACGIEVDSLDQQLQKAEAEVKRLQSLIEEENKPKVGDWVWNKSGTCYYVKELNNSQTENEIKITDDNFIKMLNECSTKN